MKILALFFILSGFLATKAMAAEEQCVPSASVLCTIDAVCDGSYGYYTLNTTFQRVSGINVDGGSSDCTFSADDKVLAAAHQKLVDEAQKLKNAGACSIVIDNIDN